MRFSFNAARAQMPNTTGGTDHGWDNHHLVVRGAVKGGDVFGPLSWWTRQNRYRFSAVRRFDSPGCSDGAALLDELR